MHRIDKLVGILEETGLDCCIVTAPVNFRYFLGFATVTKSYLVVSKSDFFVVTPELEYEEVKEKACGVDVRAIGRKEKNVEVVAREVKKIGAKKIGVDGSDSYDSVQKLISALEANTVESISSKISELRAVKDADEVAKIARAVEIAEKALEKAVDIVDVGVSERDVAIELEYTMRKLGAENIAFDTIVASGPRAAIPHAKASDRKISPGDTVVVDLGCVCDGYVSDLTRTIVLSPVKEEVKRAVEAVAEAQEQAIKSIADGVKSSEVDGVARRVLASYGLERFFMHGLGHGIGLEVHELPRLSSLSDYVLRNGNVVTVEPGVYLPGSFGVRIEDDVVIDGGKAKKLSHFDTVVFK